MTKAGVDLEEQRRAWETILQVGTRVLSPMNYVIRSKLSLRFYLTRGVHCCPTPLQPRPETLLYANDIFFSPQKSLSTSAGGLSFHEDRSV